MFNESPRIYGPICFFELIFIGVFVLLLDLEFLVFLTRFESFNAQLPFTKLIPSPVPKLLATSQLDCIFFTKRAVRERGFFRPTRKIIPE